MSTRRRNEDGFTLVEVLVTTVILSVIMLPLGNMLLGYLRTTTQTTARLAESHDAQMAGAYFSQDVASLGLRDSSDVLATSVWVGSTSSAPYTCGSAGVVLALAWDDYVDASTKSVYEVAYWIRTASSERQLVRTSCSGTAASATSVVVAHDVDPATAPVVSCAGGCTGAPASITLTLSIKDPGSRQTAYPVTLRGDRRQTP